MTASDEESTDLADADALAEELAAVRDQRQALSDAHLEHLLDDASGRFVLGGLLDDMGILDVDVPDDLRGFAIGLFRAINRHRPGLAYDLLKQRHLDELAARAEDARIEARHLDGDARRG